MKKINFFKKENKNIKYNLLKKINKNFSYTLEKFFFKKMNFLIKVKNLDIFCCKFSFLKKYFNQSISYITVKFFPTSDYFYFIIPNVFIFEIIENVFGGNNLFINKKNDINNNFFLNKFVLKDFFSKFIKLYLLSWSKVCLLEINIIHDLQFSFFSNYLVSNMSNSYIISSFFFKFKNIFNKFYILIPYNLKNKINILLYKKNKTNIINIIKKIKYTIIVKSRECNCTLKNILNIKKNNVIPINNPKKIVVYINNIPLINGNYKILDNKSIILFKKKISKKIFFKKIIGLLLMHNKINKNKNILKKTDVNIKDINYFDKTLDKKNLKIDVPKINVKDDFLFKDIDIISKIPIKITIELSSLKIKIEDLLKIKKNSTIILNNFSGKLLNVFINNFLIAKGEIVFYKKKYGIRIIKVINSKK
ncbi:MAG: hypothetical protein G8D24_01625 [Buchnera aphidicola (Periphyllus lyropictus)]|uniref:FliM/FliN family flagellar motor switch protein n=1 Tax=Buchnera aphidicola TaxID=9 RepID=UPI001EB90367|nr:FliM/FliN family flagellar motor switch protein [Buchnera aphidicola]NIH16748.1 hypothetical protein [Buchnera aphidicola (Periphyllus lyropictus)]USS94649.1 FliM/FliN family flagellar motor switch protein [Buchnera aphidicola (Periphyllus lyropictus)]